MENLKLTSSVFNDGDYIPAKYTCDGENVSPPLEISDVPESAKSLVLIVDDPDAPAEDWVHWTLWNIPPDIKNISEGSAPASATEGITDFGRPGYGGPCPPRVDEVSPQVEAGPPSGVHHYQFKLYALEIFLNLNSSSTKKDIERAMGDHVISETSLIGLYQKK